MGAPSFAAIHLLSFTIADRGRKGWDSILSAVSSAFVFPDQSWTAEPALSLSKGALACARRFLIRANPRSSAVRFCFFNSSDSGD